MNMRYRYNVGDVISINFRNFDNEIVTGMFLIIYKDACNSHLIDNFTAVKISSKKYTYSVTLSCEDVPFLKHTSYVNCNHQFRFREHEIKYKMGVIPKTIMKSIGEQIVRYNNKVATQCGCV